MSTWWCSISFTSPYVEVTTINHSVDKLDENDTREAKLKRVSDAYLDEYTKAKENHKDSLFLLKTIYERFGVLNTRIETDLDKKVLIPNILATRHLPV
jgi:hypothetical protein